MADLRKCSGSTKFGIEAHEAPPDEFPAQPSHKDGLGRGCKAHWNQYTSALRKAALARKAADGGEATEAAPTEAESVATPEPIRPHSPRRRTTSPRGSHPTTDSSSVKPDRGHRLPRSRGRWPARGTPIRLSHDRFLAEEAGDQVGTVLEVAEDGYSLLTAPAPDGVQPQHAPAVGPRGPEAEPAAGEGIDGTLRHPERADEPARRQGR